MAATERMNFKEVKNYMQVNMERPVDWNDSHEFVKSSPVKPVIYTTYNSIENEVYSHKNQRTHAIIYKNNELISKTKWYVCRNNVMNGPYYTQELQGMIKMFEIVDSTLLKRETDKQFLPFRDIKMNISNFDVLDELYANKLNEKAKVAEDIPFDVKLQNCKETNRFLACNRSELNLSEIIKYVRGKTYKDALDTLKKLTNMGELKNKKVLQLLQKELNEKIIKK